MTNDIGKRLAVFVAGLALNGAAAAAVDHSGLWWNPAESGWGVAIEEQGNVVSAVMATYDQGGQPVWFVLPRAEHGVPESVDAATPSTFSGMYYVTTGMAALDTCTRCGDPPLFPEHVVATGLGSAGFVFNPDGTATFMTPTSSLGSKSIVPEVFAATESSCSGDNPASSSQRYQGFWANANESGWALYLAHQADVIFGIWLTYAPNGSPRWYSMPFNKGEGNSYSGSIVFSTGPSFDDPLYDATRVGAMEVGSASITFDDRNNAHLAYNLPGLYAGTREVARQVFSDAEAVQAAATCN